MAEIFLVRHGQASFGAEDYDRLSALGHRQSAWLAALFVEKGLRFDRALSGTLRRQRDTLTGLAPALDGVACTQDARLNEMDYEALLHAMLAQTGEQMPHSREAFIDLMPRLMTAWADGTLPDQPETYSQFEDRVLGCVTDMAKTGERVLLVTSGGVIGMVLRWMLGLDPAGGTHLMLNVRNASYHQVTFEMGHPRLAQFNAISHLMGPGREDALTYV
ncbi:MAG: histidine phosphatase family protein [Pseudomonadota bacterium]